MKKTLLILLVALPLLVATKGFSQNVSINTTGNAADASAMLDVTSTNMGVLIPRMTQAQRTAIASPANALLVYQTDGTNGFYYYSTFSSSWIMLASSAGTISSLNGLTATSQTFATGTSGTDFAISSSGSVHTFNLPNASGSARGVIATGAQTFAGAKTFSSAPLFSSLTAGSVPFIGTGGLLSQNNSGFFWDAANSRLGLGTNTPTQKLDVNGTIVASGTTYPNYAYNSANRIAFGETNVPANETGSVVQYGSGSSSRNMLFAFTKSSVNTSFLGNDGTQMVLGTEATAPITFRTGLSYLDANILASGSEAMRITSGGNVGIGTTAPATKLHIAGTNPLTLMGVAAGTSTAADSLLTITSGLVRKLPMSTFASPANSWSTTGNRSTSSATNFVGTSDNASLRFRTNNSSRMHLDSLGGLFVGDSATSYANNINNTQAGFRSEWTTSILSGDTPRIAAQGQIRVNLISTSGSATMRGISGTAFTGVSNGVTSTADINGGYFTGHRRTIGSITDGTGTLNAITGVGISYGHTSAANAGGTTTNVYGLKLNPNYGAGSITNLYGLAITAPATGGNVTNMYDIFLANHALTGVTNSWGIYQANTKNNYFAGKIGIGTSSPLTALHIQSPNPLTLIGVADGTSTTADSLLTITNGLVRKLPMSTFASPTGSWSTTGNSSATFGANFLGTTDATSSLRFRTNNTQRLLIDSAGNIAIGNAPVQTAGLNAEKLLIDAGTTAANPTTSYNLISAKGYINSYLQFNIQNKSADTAASADIVATTDIGDETSGFIDMGINSSGNTSTGAIGGANTAYLYSTGNDLAIGNGTAGKSVTFFTGGLTPATYTERFRLDANGRVGIGTKTPTSDLSINQSSGSGSTKGITLSGNSIGGSSSGTGFLLSLGFNATSNKQLWLGDPDYAGNNAGTFARIEAGGTNLPTINAISGNNGARRFIAIGTGGDANAGVLFGSDGGGTTSPGSFVWDNGNMAIGNGYKASVAPVNGLLVQGNIGIGTTTPSQKLDVNGTIVSSSTSYPNFAYNAANRMVFGEPGTVPTEAGSVVHFGSGSSTRNMMLAITKTGVNTSFVGNDGTKLMLGSEGTIPITFRTGLDYSSTDVMASGTETMRITSNGNVGIGTNTPTNKLDVVGNSGALISAFTSTNAAGRTILNVANSASNGGSVSLRAHGSTYSETILGNNATGASSLLAINSGNGLLGIGTYNAGDVLLGTNNNERMRILSGGNVGIGTNTPGYLLTVAGIVAPSADNAYSLGGGTGNRWSVVYATNGTIQTSDRRLKTNIKNLNYGLKEIMAMQPVSYNWKEKPTTDNKIGLIAQDVQKLVPEVVTGDETKEKLGMNYAELVPVLINAIKELQKQIDELKQKVSELQKNKKTAHV